MVTIEYILKKARENNWSLASYQGKYYIYCNSHWMVLTDECLKEFLGSCAEQIKIDRLIAKHFRFKDDLMKQFHTDAYFSPPLQSESVTKINLANCTYNITKYYQAFKQHDTNDFMRYKLSFNYDPSAICPKFNTYLDRVLPDK